MGYREHLRKGYYEYRQHIPGRFLYHRDFFRVRRLLAADAEGMLTEAETRLRHILKVAIGHVPFYRRIVRLSPGELDNESPSELLKRFPYVSKAQIMDCQRDFLDERLDPRKLIYVTSEGSTGQGIGVWRTKRLADIEKAFYTHEWGKLGFSFDKVRYLRMGADAIAPANAPPIRVTGNRMLLCPHHLSSSNKAAIIAALNKFRPQFVHSYASAAAALSEIIANAELDFQMRAVLLASEPATTDQLALIERLFACPISISYGLTERTNLAFASCHNQRCGSFKFQPLYGVSENRRVEGCDEIVGTSCWNDVMPLIRYCTDDFGTIDESGSCSAIQGRGQDFLFDRQGGRIPGLWIVIDERIWEFVRLCQIRQLRPGAIEIRVVPRCGALGEDQKQFILQAQQERWGSRFDIELDEVSDIPLRSNGKRQFVNREPSAAT